MIHEDVEGDAVIIGPDGPRQLTTKGYIQNTIDNKQDGLGLPSFNIPATFYEGKELTGEDQRILSALGFSGVKR